MRLAFVSLLAACSTPAPGPSGDDTAPDAPAGDPIAAVFAAVDQDHLKARLDELTGAHPVSADGNTFSLTNRWSPSAKASFRAYWNAYFTQLGASVGMTTFSIPNLVGETEGHNLEAILPGKSADSVVIIVHYDTVGLTGHETENPGADDDGTGLAMQMEAARIFAQFPDRAQTVRFVAADYLEITDTLDGDVAYVQYLQHEAQTKGFQILVASDNDQTGWSCWSEDSCGGSPPPTKSTFEMITCSGDSHHYDYPELMTGMADLASRLGSSVAPTRTCDGSGDTDHYPFWVAGIPAYVIEEWAVGNNNHYGDAGGDTMAHIDLDLLTSTAKLQIAFQAKLAGIGARD